ncbi:MAG: nuclear transport factor 2 family protein [Myxococcota bacterium]
MGTDIEARLRRLEDLQAIQQLFVDYGQHLDAGDVDAYAALFTEDGELKLGPLGKAKGREQIKAVMARSIEGSSARASTSSAVRRSGSRATMLPPRSCGRSCNGVRTGKPVLPMIGRHRDELVQDADGSWRFRVRRGFVDIPSKLG